MEIFSVNVSSFSSECTDFKNVIFERKKTELFLRSPRLKDGRGLNLIESKNKSQ